MIKCQNVSFSMPKDMIKKLDYYANKKRVSRSLFIRWMIQDFIEEEENKGNYPTANAYHGPM